MYLSRRSVFLLFGMFISLSQANRMIVLNKLPGTSASISHISHQLPGGSMTIIRSFPRATSQNYNMYTPLNNYFSSAPSPFQQNVPANYATTTATAFTQHPTKTNNSQKIRKYAQSPKTAAPMQPAVTAFYHPGVAASGHYAMASAAVQPAGTIGYNIPTASSQEARPIGYNNPTAAIQQAVTANSYSTPAAAIQQAVTANQHSSPAEAFKGLAERPRNQYSSEGMSSGQNLPMYDTLFSGIYGGKKDNSYDGTLGQGGESSRSKDNNEHHGEVSNINTMQQQEFEDHVSNKHIQMELIKQALQDVFMRDLEQHSNLHDVLDMDQMRIPDGMETPDYITPDQNETPGPFAPRFKVEKREISEAEAMQEIQQALEDAGLYPDVLPTVPEALVNLNYGFHGCIHLGTEIDPYVTVSRPRRVTFPANSTDLHTLVLLDANTRLLHWLVVNIPGGKVRQGQEIAAYQPPASSPDMHSAAIENHNIVMAVLRQQNGFVSNSEGYFGARLCEWGRRQQFDLNFLAAKLDLQLTAANFFSTYSEPMISEEVCLNTFV